MSDSTLRVLRLVCPMGHEIARAFHRDNADDLAWAAYNLGRRVSSTLEGHFCLECRTADLTLVDQAARPSQEE
ncbi:hypothetical protein OJF2_35530 [Aquisphaera giovannonii]|uniref:Uncharacterized protein n=1 Tax=Aquisphaera giovannonii TaxID=406548 RepID=A0A5B9W337_9BACT|nr:hypothetical protein [Aquisphaera giovannonii]QEH35008.1 hypothetical protein OJF2_35530 [Aquisphaera giovannonii]